MFFLAKDVDNSLVSVERSGSRVQVCVVGLHQAMDEGWLQILLHVFDSYSLNDYSKAINHLKEVTLKAIW